MVSPAELRQVGRRAFEACQVLRPVTDDVWRCGQEMWPQISLGKKKGRRGR